MKVAVVGATGVVGAKMLEVLEEQGLPVRSLLPVASARSVGRTLRFRGKDWTVVDAETALAQAPDLALFSAGGAVSEQLAPRFAAAGCRVIDNSSFWRMHPAVPLVVPEINAGVLTAEDRLIANPNCSTIQMVLPLAPLHRAFGIKRIVVSTYQSVTGAGQAGIAQLEAERAGGTGAKFPHPIDLNVLPHIDVFLEDGSTREEWKMVHETRKILGDEGIGISATTVRVPVKGGHSESVNVELRKPFTLNEIRELIGGMDGVVIQDEPAQNLYPMPLNAWGRDEVFVGRIRRDPSVENGLNFWCVSDNLRKGAATNAVQIAKLLLERGWLGNKA